MIRISTQQVGLRWAEAARSFQDMQRRVTRDAMGFALGEAKRTARGRLAQALRAAAKDDGFTVESDSKIVGFVEWGTAAHVIEASHARTLAFRPAGGGVAFAKRVHHPGTKGTHFIEKAIVKASDLFVRRFELELASLR